MAPALGSAVHVRARTICARSLALKHAGLHYDGLDNMHVLLTGEKLWKLYAPDDARHLQLIIPPNRVFPNGYVAQAQWDQCVQEETIVAWRV